MLNSFKSFSFIGQSLRSFLEELGMSLLAFSHVDGSHTGTTTETVLGTLTIPANAIGANGTLMIVAIFGSANGGAPGNRTARVRFNGIGGTVLTTMTLTSTNRSGMLIRFLSNRNAANSQIVLNSASSAFGGSISGDNLTMSVDTTAPVDVVATGQLTATGDVISIQDFFIVKL